MGSKEAEGRQLERLVSEGKGGRSNRRKKLEEEAESREGLLLWVGQT